MTRVVIDASAGVELLLATPEGRRLSQAISSGSDVFVPEVYLLEVAATLRRMELRGVVSEDRAAFALRRLLTLKATRVQIKPLLTEAWSLRHNVTVPDALYVVLARRLNASLLTADQRLARAPGLGVTILS